MCAPTRTMYPFVPTGHSHEVESPTGGFAGLRPQNDSMVLTKSISLCPNRWPRLAREAARAAERPGHAARARHVRWRGHQVELEGEEVRGRRYRVEHHRVLDGLVADQQVVVHLHDDKAAGRQVDPGPVGQVVGAVAGCPRAQPWRVGDVAERGAGDRCLAEAAPPLPVDVRGLGRGREGGRHEEEDGVMVLGTAREELARDDVGVGGDVGVEHRAVVVVGAALGRAGCVGGRLVQVDGRHRGYRRDGRADRRSVAGHAPGDPGHGRDHQREDDEDESPPRSPHGSEPTRRFGRGSAVVPGSERRGQGAPGQPVVSESVVGEGAGAGTGTAAPERKASMAAGSTGCEKMNP